MPPAITDLPVQLDPPRKRWTRSEYEELGSSGLLNGERLELVEGELISKMGKKRPHVNSVALLQGLLVEVFGVRFVNAAAPIDAAPEDNPSNEPEPDVIVLKRDLSHYRNEIPRPQDLQLVVEIADSTLGFDITTKAALYARAGVIEYWVLDIRLPPNDRASRSGGRPTRFCRRLRRRGERVSISCSRLALARKGRVSGIIIAASPARAAGL